VSVSLEILGDKWTLLVIRDLMVRGARTFKDFQSSSERIATNILSDRLRRLEAAEIVVTEPDENDRRRVNYRLTDKGMDLAPLLMDLLIWGARHEKTGAPAGLAEKMEAQREPFLAEARRRWEVRDHTPLLPSFGSSKTAKEKR
jgi:DNA-binding HxlR family transcriptional regulator